MVVIDSVEAILRNEAESRVDPYSLCQFGTRRTLRQITRRYPQWIRQLIHPNNPHGKGLHLRPNVGRSLTVAVRTTKLWRILLTHTF